MAGHAKFFAVYDRPFWREAGLCGSAISRRGPLAEIHDASPKNEATFSLFGFVGLDGPSRRQLSRDEFGKLALEQLAQLFGDAALSPIQIYYQDWSTELYTAAAADQQPQTRHPQYGLTLDLGEGWGNQLHFISSESSYRNGGLIEGALEMGIGYAQKVTGLMRNAEEGTDHKASMDWDWLEVTDFRSASHDINFYKPIG